jgi:hypothetical protein
LVGYKYGIFKVTIVATTWEKKLKISVEIASKSFEL